MRGVLNNNPSIKIPKIEIPQIPIQEIPVLNILESYNKCRRCNKTLKDPKSKLLGYGPDCYKKHLQETRRKLF